MKVPAGAIPQQLRELPEPPKELFYKGNLELLAQQCLGVVGSRKMTTYGQQVTNRLVSELAGRGLVIVSGFMYGIDAMAHEVAIAVGGYTIAVMPCGIDICIPPGQKWLYDKILDSDGLIISEYAGTFAPKAWTFVKRNRLIAGLSAGVLVIEAAKNSGSLVTAKFAKKYKRKVLTVPGNITGENGLGVLQLLQEGASAVGDASDVFAVLGLKKDVKGVDHLPQKKPLFPGLEQEVINLLMHEKLSLDDLLMHLGGEVSTVSAKLNAMQIKGLIAEKGGYFYVC